MYYHVIVIESPAYEGFMTVVLNRWATARKLGGPRLLILISTNKENITEIEKKYNANGPQTSVYFANWSHA